MASYPDDVDEKYNRPAPAPRRAGRGVEVRPQHMALQSVSSTFPKRPDATSADLPPQAGTRFPVLSNSFPVRLRFPKDQIAKYDLKFEPALPEDASMERQRIVRSIRSNVEQMYGQIYLDNTRVYALNIVQDDQSFNTPSGGRVTFRLGQCYKPTDMDPQTQVQIASIMLQRILRDSNLLRLGRAHFEQQDHWRTVQVNTEGFCNLKLWPGYRISIEPAMSGLRLSVDVCHRVLETRSVRQFMDARWDQLYGMHSQNPNMDETKFNGIFRKNVKDELIGRAVLTLYNKRVWRVDDIDFSQKITDVFEQSDGNKITYKDYVKQRYNVDASSSFEGLLVNLPKMRKMDQGSQRQVFIIPELAYLTGYSKAMRSNRRLMKQVSDQTRVPAATRWKMAESVIKRLNQVAQDQKTPLQIASTAKAITGRILPAYKIFLRKGNACDVTGPKDLQRNWARSDFMEKGAPLSKWAVVYEGQGGKGNATKMVEGLREQAKRARIPPAAFNANPLMVPIEMRRNVPQDKCWKMSILHNVINKFPDIQAIFAVIPARANDKQSEEIYSAVKQVCSVEKGVLTQCVKGGNCGNKHVINGIFKQMFIKLGSIPWKVQFDLPGNCLNLGVPTMLVGMDANHDRKQKLSSVAMVASYDRDFVRYHTNVAYQQLGQEIIDHVETMFSAAMENFRKVNTVYPKQVIIYRDGVSNTQLEAVAKDEIRPIRNALRKLGATDTKFEFIVVQKRIVARFINESNKETVHPGTIISDEVTSSQFWDFFLVPCSPPPGCTATPTRFIVVEDGLGLANKRGMVDLETFTNQLCALYFNWPGSIRVPACVKYAYKLSQQFSQAMHSTGTPASKLLLTYHFL